MGTVHYFWDYRPNRPVRGLRDILMMARMNRSNRGRKHLTQAEVKAIIRNASRRW